MISYGLPLQFQHVPLYLEWAPVAVFTTPSAPKPGNPLILTYQPAGALTSSSSFYEGYVCLKTQMFITEPFIKMST